MNRTRKNLWLGMLVGGLLFALPAAADGDKCEADCATKTSEPMQTCILKCPTPSNTKDPKAMRSYQACAQRCSGNFEERFNTCKKKCADRKTQK